MNPYAAQFPVNLNIEGKPVLLVGGGRIAYRKAEQLLVCNPLLTVISPEIDERFHATGATLIQREYAPLDVKGFSLVVTATANNVVAQQIFDECEALGIWVNSADDPDRCTFTLPAACAVADFSLPRLLLARAQPCRRGFVPHWKIPLAPSLQKR